MERQHYIDWLRVLTMLGVFVFHCVRFFDPLPWHLKNPELSESALIFVAFLNGWFMELFFLLAGFAAWYALRKRTLGRFIKDRFLRLVIPIYTVGLFILLPPQRWWDLQTLGQEVGGFLAYYPEFITSLSINPLSPFFLSPWPGHLWFLRFLFTISIASLPLLLWLRSGSGRKILDIAERHALKWGGIWLILPLLITLKVFFPAPPGEHSWNAMLSYGVYFWVGYVLAARPQIGRAFRGNIWLALLLGLMAFGGICCMLAMGYVAELMSSTPSAWKLALWNGISAVDTWAWLVFVLGAGGRWLDRPGAVLNRLDEAVLPFYILHQSVILYMGWWLGPVAMPIWGKLALLIVSSLALTTLCYEYLVRPWNPIRWAFGMSPKAQK
jgi:glucan biosynthesis protein C